MVIVELKEMETSSGIYEEEDNIQIDFGEGTEANLILYDNESYALVNATIKFVVNEIISSFKAKSYISLHRRI